MTRSLSRYAIGSTLAACAVLSACQKKGDVAVTDTTAAPAAAPAMTDTTASAGTVAPTKTDWTDAQILAFASAANAGEIQEATIAESKATSPAVKSFARLMVADHKKMQADGKALATKLAITPDSTRSDVTDLSKDVSDQVKDLNDKQAGKDWDTDYVGKQVDDHQKVLDTLQDASKSAQNPELKDALSKAIGKVQEHLTKAKNLKDATQS
jgi:putative membrane protein